MIEITIQSDSNDHKWVFTNLDDGSSEDVLIDKLCDRIWSVLIDYSKIISYKGE